MSGVPPTTRHRVLIVDDEPDVLAVLAALASPSFEVVTATNGLDALLKLPRVDPDLIISDIMMPVMDGIELAKRIRGLGGYEKLPFIFVSALDSQQQIRDGYLAGANVYITKPFEPDRVLKNIAVALAGIPSRSKAHTVDEIAVLERSISEGPVRSPSREQIEVGRKIFKTFGEKEAERHAPPPARPSRSGEHAVAPAAPAPPAKPSGPRVRILIVDDDPDILTYITLILQNGFEVLTAHDGLEAVHKIAESQPDILVLDGMMPKISGFQLVEMLRNSVDSRHLPIIFISAKDTARDRRMVQGHGVLDYLHKPFGESELMAAVDRIAGSPDFQVKAKKLDYKRLVAGEARAAQDKESRERGKYRAQSYETINKFLKANEDRDPFGFRAD